MSSACNRIQDALLIEGQVFALSLNAHYHPLALTFYQQMVQKTQHSMLLESVDVQHKTHLKSMLVTHVAMKIECNQATVTFTALSDNGENLLPSLQQAFRHFPHYYADKTLQVEFTGSDKEQDEDSKLQAASPLDGLRFFLQKLDVLGEPDRPIFLSGVLAYDLIAQFESLPAVANGFNDCPDYLFYVAETMIVLDHQSRHSTIVSHVFGGKNASKHKDQLNLRALDILEKSASTTMPHSCADPVVTPVVTSIDDAQFCAMVTRLKSHIESGDIFQVVPSRSFTLPCENPLASYQALKELNPSPYMFYLSTPDFTLFGASPESALKYSATTNQVEIYPIAGTRKRGRNGHGQIDHDLDSRIELELRQDKKELAEHLMLVDLARNDIARISKPGSRQVPELLKVDRYSHVMHLVSRVTGQLKSELDALHAYQACMNMGTLVGAPKVKAAQLIRQVEQQRRGSYGGAVGYLNSAGDMDTCIVIRSAFVKNGIAQIQAGAGVVFDSDPQAEADETRSKAQAVINAIQAAGGL